MKNPPLDNFWYGIKEKYPEYFNDFSEWFKVYKEKVGWKKIFNEIVAFRMYASVVTKAPKFYKLPIAMQIGIFLQYVSEKKSSIDFKIHICKENDKSLELILEDIEDWFKQQSK